MFNVLCLHFVGVLLATFLEKKRNNGYNNDIKMILFKIISDIIVTL